MVKKTFRYTHVGRLPEDWDCVQTNEVINEISMGPFGSDITVSNFVSSGVPVLNGYNVSQIILIDKFQNFVTLKKAKQLKKAVAHRGDIIVTHRGTIGQVSYIPDSSTHSEYVISQSQFRVHFNDKKVNSHFLVSYLLSPIGQKYLLETKGHTGVPALAQPTTNFRRLWIPLPEIAEQVAIAEALSDADNLISSLQKLIEKKKAIKQGAMQQLLTGKKRLPGFSGEWKREQLPELLQEQNGIKIGPFGSQLRKEYLTNIGGFKVYGQENVYEKDFRLGTRYLSKERYLKLKSCELLPGDFVISSMGTVGKCSIVPPNIQSGIMDSHLIRLKFNCKKIVSQYMLQLFSDEFYFLRNQIEKLSVGGIMEGLSTKIVQLLNVFYPVDTNEQKAICAILNDMDSEIAQLEKKLAKYQQIKQGMMQELLTGRIRLVNADGKEQPQAAQKKQPQPAHNQHFDDAVMIAGIVNAFYSERYPLGRKKIQKLLYLIRRKEQADISAFHKKAAGPYADKVRYKGGEPIAQKNKYIRVKRNEKGNCFEKGVQIQQALAYLQDWGKQADIDWLVSQFQYTSVNELELLATVDMAICDLRREGKEISVASIKDLISSNKEWRDKLKKAYFKDADIQRAIKRCRELFPDKEG